MKRLLTITKVTTVAAIAAIVVASGSTAHGQADNWTGSGDGTTFLDGANWDTGNVPGVIPGSDLPFLSTNNIDGPFTVNRSVDSNTARVNVRGGSVLNITGGIHGDDRSGANIFNYIGDDGSGTVNQSGGEFNIGHGVRIGVGVTATTRDGTYNLTGGDLIVYRGSNSIVEPFTFGRPSMEIGDTAGQALFEISGGSLSTRGGVHIGQNGTFSVKGSNPVDIGSTRSADGSWIQHGTLKAAIGAAGFNDILVDDVDDNAGVFGIFRPTSLLDLSFDGIAPVAGTWTLMTVENTDILDEGLALAGGTDPNWSFAIDNTGTDGLLTATYAVSIPEPSSLALLGLGGLVLVGRRRKLR